MAFVSPFRLRERVPLLGLLGPAVLGLSAGLALAQPAAPSDSVIVDWSALDVVRGASAPSGAAPVTLIAPPKRVVVVLPPPEKPAAPAQAASAVVTPPAVNPSPAPRPAGPAVVIPAPAAPAPQQVAAATIPRAAAVPAPAPSRVTMVRYAAGASDIPADGHAALDAVAATLAANDKLRLQLVAYASGSGDDAIAPRRLSLTRAVQMRAYLIAKGVPSIRMEVRAFGNQGVGTGPADRVDLVIVDR